MKVQEIKNYGFSGLSVKFSLADCFAATEVCQRITDALDGEKYNLLDPEDRVAYIDEVEDILTKVKILLDKISVSPSEQATIFSVDSEEGSEESNKECK